VVGASEGEESEDQSSYATETEWDELSSEKMSPNSHVRETTPARPPNGNRIYSMIREILVPAKTIGYVYIIDVASRKGVFKVGYTTKTEKRYDAIEKKCGIKVAEMHIRGPTRHFKVLEKLVHADLKDYRCKFECRCSQAHREWFEVDVEVAKRAVNRWTAFVEMEPWSPDPELTTFWKWRFHELSQRERKWGATLASRNMHLDRFISPLYVDYWPFLLWYVFHERRSVLRFVFLTLPSVVLWYRVSIYILWNILGWIYF
jgi:hypothetical protein